MIEIDFQGVQLGPNPAYAGENVLISVKVSGKALRWNDIRDRTWNEVSNKGWD